MFKFWSAREEEKKRHDLCIKWVSKTYEGTHTTKLLVEFDLDMKAINEHGSSFNSYVSI